MADLFDDWVICVDLVLAQVLVLIVLRPASKHQKPFRLQPDDALILSFGDEGEIDVVGGLRRSQRLEFQFSNSFQAGRNHDCLLGQVLVNLWFLLLEDLMDSHSRKLLSRAHENLKCLHVRTGIL